MLTLYEILPHETNPKYVQPCVRYLDSFYRGLEQRPNTNLHLYNTCTKHVDIVFKAILTNRFTFDETDAYFTTVIKKSGRLFTASENKQIKHYIARIESNREIPLHLLFISTNLTYQKNNLGSFVKSSNEMSNRVIDKWTDIGLIKHSSFHTGNFSHIRKSTFKLSPIFDKCCDKNRMIDIHDHIATCGAERYIDIKLHEILNSMEFGVIDPFYVDDILVLGFCMKILSTSFKLSNLLNISFSDMFCLHFKEASFYEPLKQTTDMLSQSEYFFKIKEEKLLHKNNRKKGQSKDDFQVQHMCTPV